MTFRFRILAAAAAAALVGAAPGPSAADTKVLPGYWESTTQYTLLMSQTSTKRQCLTTEEVEQWLTRPAPKHFTCSYDRKRVGGGLAHFEMSCTDARRHTLKLTINGTYAPERFHLAAEGSLTMMGVPLPGSAVIDAHRLSAECPAPADTDAGK